MSPEEVYALAGSVARSFRLPPDQTDDLRQEAAIGMIFGSANLDRSRPMSDQRGYLGAVGRSRALDYLNWRGRSAAREVSVSVFAGENGSNEDGYQVAQSLGNAAFPTPEDYVSARAQASRAMTVLEAGMARLSSQEAALLRHKLGREEMREDLVRLGAGPRGSVSNRARRKLMAVAEEMDAADIVTPELLLRLFGHQRD